MRAIVKESGTATTITKGALHLFLTNTVRQ
jgi:hypothetical protein